MKRTEAIIAAVLVLVSAVFCYGAGTWGPTGNNPVKSNANPFAPAYRTYSSAGVNTLDLAANNRFKFTFKNSSTSVALANGNVHQVFDLKIKNSSGAARIPTLWTTITWVGGANPATITNTKTSWYLCDITGTNTYDCLIRAENY